MKNVFTVIFSPYRKYRAFTKRSKAYKIINYTLSSVFAIYALLLIFPSFLYGHQMSHKNFKVYAREPLRENIVRVLDSAEERLVKSPIYNKDLQENLLMADSFGFYKFQTLSGRSMGSTIPIIAHSRINKADIENDLVFRDGEPPNRRSLSGVIAHETMHNQIRVYLRTAKYYSTPTWKDEGYCEYTAGETTLSFEEGKKLWQENPDDDSRYAYFKYHQMVKYLLEVEKISVADLFKQSFDEKELAAKVFAKISNMNS